MTVKIYDDIFVKTFLFASEKRKLTQIHPMKRKKKSEKVESAGGEGGRIGKIILRLHQEFIRTLLMSTNQNPTAVD